VLAFSRILNDLEVIVVTNTNTQAGWTGEVIVDLALRIWKYKSWRRLVSNLPG